MQQDPRKPRPQFRNLGLFTSLPAYVFRFPPTAIVSLLHRVSGALLFLLLPAIIWLFDTSVSSEISFAKMSGVFDRGIWIFPGWLFKLALLVIAWSFVYHMIAGLRHVWMDVSHSATDKKSAMNSAKTVLILSLVIAVVLAAKVFGLY